MKIQANTKIIIGVGIGIAFVEVSKLYRIKYFLINKNKFYNSFNISGHRYNPGLLASLHNKKRTIRKIKLIHWRRNNVCN